MQTQGGRVKVNKQITKMLLAWDKKQEEIKENRASVLLKKIIVDWLRRESVKVYIKDSNNIFEDYDHVQKSEGRSEQIIKDEINYLVVRDIVENCNDLLQLAISINDLMSKSSSDFKKGISNLSKKKLV